MVRSSSQQQTIYGWLRNEQPQPKPFQDAQRVTLVEGQGNQSQFVVLAVLEVHGRDYAMLAREDELYDTVDGDMSVYLFEYEIGLDGETRLSVIDDDDTYAEVFHLFSALADDDGDEDDDAA